MNNQSNQQYGTLFGVGVGPGNPEWLTLEAVRILSSCKYIFAPQARTKQDSLALEIARPHLAQNAQIQEIIFPMSKSAEVLDHAWNNAADLVEAVLLQGENACFITIGDSMLYSTYLYLRRTIEKRNPNICCKAIPGIPAFVAAASLCGIPLGEGRKPLVIVPASGDLNRVQWALESEGTVVVMKVGEKLSELQEIILEHAPNRHAMLASKVGLSQQQFIDLTAHSKIESEAAYLSLAIIQAENSTHLDLKENP